MQGIIPSPPNQGYVDPSLIQSEKQRYSNPELMQLAIQCLHATLPMPSFGGSKPEIDAAEYTARLHHIYSQLFILNKRVIKQPRK